MLIRHKLYKGSIWNAISQFGSQGINFILLIILARLLAPSDFGLLAMVTVVCGFLGYFSEFGLISTLIQKKNIDEVDCNTAFWSTIVFSVLLYGIVFVSAPLIASFYNQPALTLITRVLFIDFLIRPFGFVHSALEIKALNYDKITIAQLISLFVSSPIAIALALLGYGIWSLVFQQITKSLLEVTVLVVSVHWRPRLIFSLGRFKELLGFGIYYTAHNVIKFFTENIDHLLVGKLLGPAALGIYTMAFRLSRYPKEKLWSVFGRMLFPAFSTFQDDLRRLRQNIMRVSLAGSLVLVPFVVILLFGTKPVVALLGEKWSDTVPIIRIFMAYIFFSSISIGDEPLLLAINKVKTLNCLKGLTSVVLLVFGYIAIRDYGLIGMAAVFTFVSILYIALVKRSILYCLKINIWDFLSNLKFVFLYTTIMFMLTGLYALYAHGKLNSLSYLLGEVLIVGFLIILIMKKYRLVDFKKMKLNIDRIITVS